MIFEKVGKSVDPYISSIILAVALIFGSLSTTYFADIIGRRVLNIGSLFGSACGLLSMSLYHYLYVNDYDLSAFHWVPVISLSFVIFISSAGIVSLAFVCSVENLPTKVFKIKRLANYLKYKLIQCFKIIYKLNKNTITIV